MERYCKLHWSSSGSSRRSSSEPTSSLVDSGRSSLTSYGSEESLSSDELEVFSDGYSDYEDDEDCITGWLLEQAMTIDYNLLATACIY